MEHNLLLINFNKKNLDEIRLYLIGKFIDIFEFNFNCLQNELEKIKKEKFWKTILKHDFFIIFDQNSFDDLEKLEMLENFLAENDLTPEQIIIYSIEKYQNFNGIFDYLYDFILKPFSENLFNAKLNSILKKYFIFKKIKDNLNDLAIKTQYHLLINPEQKKILVIGKEPRNIKKIFNFLSEKHIVKTAPFKNIYKNFLIDYPNSFDVILINDIDNIHHLIFLYNKIKGHEDLNESIIIFLMKNTDAIFLADIVNLGVDNYIAWPKNGLDNLEKIINLELKNKNYYDFLNEELQNAFLSSVIDETSGAFSKKYFINLLEKNSENKILQKKIGIIMIDVNEFKKINDKFGHVFGDFVLKELTITVKKEIKNKVFARFGGDEFMILIDKESILNKESLSEIVFNIKNVVKNKFFSFEGKKIKIEISAGFAISDKGEDFMKLIYNADNELYKDKKEK